MNMNYDLVPITFKEWRSQFCHFREGRQCCDLYTYHKEQFHNPGRKIVCSAKNCNQYGGRLKKIEKEK